MDFRSLEDPGFQSIRSQIEAHTPFLDVLRLSDHLVDLLAALNPLVGLLEKALTNIGKLSLVLADFRR